MRQDDSPSSSSDRGTTGPIIRIGILGDEKQYDLILDDFLAKKEKERQQQEELSPECVSKANETFDLFESDAHSEVDEESFVNHWTELEARVSATEFFAVLDQRNLGKFSRVDFVEFWRRVKA